MPQFGFFFFSLQINFFGLTAQLVILVPTRDGTHVPCSGSTEPQLLTASEVPNLILSPQNTFLLNTVYTLCSGSQIGATLPQGTLGNVTIAYYNPGKCYYLTIEGRGLGMHRTAPKTKNYLTPNVICVLLRNSASR